MAGERGGSCGGGCERFGQDVPAFARHRTDGDAIRSRCRYRWLAISRAAVGVSFDVRQHRGARVMRWSTEYRDRVAVLGVGGR